MARLTIDSGVAKRIKLVGLDIDGVLTDGGVYIGLVAHHPLEFKRFDVQDGLGVKLLRAVGLAVVLVSGRVSDASDARAKEMEVDELLEVGPKEKQAALEGALGRRSLTLAQCAYVGDDLTDLPAMRVVALPVAVANATAEVKGAARFVTSASGGHGAVREFVELLLKARGEWRGLLAEQFEARDVARRVRGTG